MAIRVLVVDDSAFMRKLLSEILNEQPDIEVVAAARNGEDALKKLEQIAVDVVTLDVEMPVMGGLETLDRIMQNRPVPVIMLSSVTKKGSETTMKALSRGAFDFIPKPSGAISLDIRAVASELVGKVRAASGAGTAAVRRPSLQPERRPVRPVLRTATGGSHNIVVAIGSSTGGPRALEQVISRIPGDLPASVVMVQHMPKGFTKSFAERLNAVGELSVKEAESGDRLCRGHAFLAPGDYHMVVARDHRIILNQDPPVQYLRPAADVMMQSLPLVYGSRVVGVILTGMGRDGAAGMALIKAAGGSTIAQDEATSVIYSMPRVVAEEGNADYVLPLERIGEAVYRMVGAMLHRSK